MPRVYLAIGVVWLGLAPAIMAQQPGTSSPSPAEIALALQEYRDAVVALKTLERVVDEGMRKRLESLLGARARAPTGYSFVPITPMAAAAVPTSGSGHPLLAAVMARLMNRKPAGQHSQAEASGALERLSNRLATLEDRLKQLEGSMKRLGDGEEKIARVLDSLTTSLTDVDRRLRALTDRIMPSEKKGESKKQ